MKGSKGTTTRVGHLCSSTKKKQKKKKKIQPYDRKFVVKQYIKSIWIHYDSNPWVKPVASIAEMELWFIPSGKPRTVDNMLL